MSGRDRSDHFSVPPPHFAQQPQLSDHNAAGVSLPPLNIPPPPTMPWVQPPSLQLPPPPLQLPPPPLQVPPPPLQLLPPPLQHPPPSLQFPPFSPDRFNLQPPPSDFSCPPPSLFQTSKLSAQCHPPVVPPPTSQDSVDLWLMKWQEKRRSKPSKEHNDKPAFSFKISSAKAKLKECSSTIKELSRLSKYLSVIHKSLPEDDWEKRTQEVINKKKRINELLAEFESHPTLLEKLQKTVSERRQKRVRLKKKRAEWQKHVHEVKIHREREHKRIDLWLENMKDEVERAKREDDIKRQADSILSSVNFKKSQAKTMLTLFTSLTKLRNVRVNKLQNSGQTVSQVDTETFNEVVGKLKSLWLKRMHEYNKEEECLKLMLTDAEAERSNVELSVAKKVLEEWVCVIFGDPSPPQHSPLTLEEFIKLRRDWDTFITSDTAPSSFSSRIPQGWVVPVCPSAADWALLSNARK